MICIDASFLIRLIADPNTPRFKTQWQHWLADGEAFVAPALLHYEVTNGLYKYQKAGIYSASTVAKQQTFALNLPIQLINTPAVHQRALDLATRWGLSATYDPHYIAVAEQFNCDLWTVDAKLVKRAQPHTNHVRLFT